MFTNDLIDKKFQRLLDYLGEYLDETDSLDYMYYERVKDFAKKHGGLLYPFDDEVYMIINFIDDDDFMIIPVDYTF